jgi:hypothetical protein
MEIDRAQVGWGVWLRWLVSSAVGLAVGFIVYFPLVVGFASDVGGVLQTLISAVGGALFGASLGIAQWLVLRRRASQPGLWVWASVAGGTVGGVLALAVGEVVGEASGFEVAVVVGGAALGASLGIAQWLVLRRHLPQAGWWILASSVGLGLGFAMGRVLGGLVAQAVGEALAEVFGTVTLATLLLVGYGAITGGALVWLLRRPSTGEPASPQSPEFLAQ